MFSHLLLRILHGMPLLVSSNWAAWILGIAIFFLTEFVLFMIADKENRWRRLWTNLLIGAGVTFFAYSVLFACSTVRTVYDDHRDSTGRWRAVVNEKNALKGLLEQRDEYVRQLRVQLAEKPAIIRKEVPQQKQCWADFIGAFPSRGDHVSSLIALHCNYRVEAPLRMTMQVSGTFADFSFRIPSIAATRGIVTGTDKGLGVDDKFWADIESPSLPADRLVLFTVESMSSTARTPIRGSINSK